MVSANGIYKLAVIGTVFSQRHIHTLHFRSTISGNSIGFDEPSWQQDLIDVWQSNCRTSYRALFATGDTPCQLYQVRKVCGTLPLPAGIDEAEAAGSTAGTTTKSGEGLPSWLANNVTTRTGLAGRRYRGRFFLGGMWEDDQAYSDVSANRLSRTQSYCDTLMSTFVTPIDTLLNAKLFVYSRTIALEGGKPCQETGSDVRTLQVRTPVASMKSRKVGHGD